jgi:hypothetical protein
VEQKYYQQIRGKMGKDMEQALLASKLLFFILGGLGIFFLGIGVLWFVSVYNNRGRGKDKY